MKLRRENNFATSVCQNKIFRVQGNKPNEKLSENLIRKKDLAQMLSLSIPMIDKLMAKGLPHYKIGKAVRFNYSEVMEHLERRKFP